MIDVFRKNSGTFAVILKNQPKLAHKVNRLLGHYYPRGTVFGFNDEPIFTFKEEQRELIAQALNREITIYG